jgi:protoporphyrinogen/coproporphyrinogen III oxidase
MPCVNDSIKIAVVGGGISGLSAAYELSSCLPDNQITLFERSHRLGGILGTEHINDCLIETSADMFLSEPNVAVELCDRLGLSDKLIEPQQTNRRSLIAFDGRLHPIPPGFSVVSPSRLDSILKTELLTSYGKLRLLAEVAIPNRIGDKDVCLEEFAIGRFGQEAFDRLIQPLIAGIYTADPKKLSVRATMPQVIAKLKQYGSLIRAADEEKNDQQRRASGARYGMFRALRGGMQQLVDALTSHLSDTRIELQSEVIRLERSQSRWRLYTSATEQPELFDHIIFALPAYSIASLFHEHDQELSRLFQSIEYASAAIVVLAAYREHFKKPLNGFGLVIPSIERRPVIAASCSNQKFAGRAPDGLDLYRVFIGGALQGELVEQNDEFLIRTANEELARWLGFDGTIQFSRVFRWKRTMPQYHVGHSDLIADIEHRIGQIPGIYLAGNAYHGVGIPMCIQSGLNAAASLLDNLSLLKQ